MGLVGESGCGKSTIGRTLVGLYKKTEGKICFRGKEVDDFNKYEVMAFKRDVQMIFQDPYASLNPRMTVYEILEEPFLAHNLLSRSDRKEKIKDLLNQVRLNVNYASHYPHEFSGGQRQRVGIARALALDPSLIICDEPISALDVSVQAQIVNMLKALQKEKGMAYLFIAHDLSMVRFLSHKIGVMYLGKIVELGETKDVYKKRFHPYTDALLSSAPIPKHRKRLIDRSNILEGEPPSPINPPSGCRFRTRCQMAKARCLSIEPDLQEVERDHFVACHLYRN